MLRKLDKYLIFLLILALVIRIFELGGVISGDCRKRELDSGFINFNMLELHYQDDCIF